MQIQNQHGVTQTVTGNYATIMDQLRRMQRLANEGDALSRHILSNPGQTIRISNISGEQQ